MSFGQLAVLDLNYFSLSLCLAKPTKVQRYAWHTEPRLGFPDGIPIVPVTRLKTSFELDGKDMSRTQVPRFGGKHMQYRLDDYARSRYHVAYA
jgi:hypothetical protein